MKAEQQLSKIDVTNAINNFSVNKYKTTNTVSVSGQGIGVRFGNGIRR